MTINSPSSPIKDLLRQQELLKKEYEYEKEIYQQQTERIGIRKKINKGLCWYPIIIGRSRYNSLNQLTIEIERREDRETEHNFEYGRPVRFFRMDLNGKCHFFNHTCHVSYAEENRMVVVLPSEAALREIGSVNELGIQLYFDETSYKTMFMALKEVTEAKNNRLAELRNLFLGTGMAPRERDLFPIRFPWLNHSQEMAVNKVLRAKDVAIVHGPPGTGKTTTLVEAIYETLHRENQVLVCAQSNMAVDWIAEKLVDRGIQVLRIGNPTRVNDKMLSFTYERRFESHPDYPELWSVRKAIRETLSGLRKRGHDSHDTIRNRLSRLRYRATELEVKIDAELFDQARVIACTLVGSANRTLENHHFTSLFIDEAAQALEAACWIAIRKADRVLLAGDHWQLPPTIKCPEAERGGLGDTLMQKIATKNPAVVSLLTTQYRMREEIMGFSSNWFYQGQLKAAPEVSHRGILRIDSPLEWIDTSLLDIPEEEQTENGSRINQAEAQIAIRQLHDYIETTVLAECRKRRRSGQFFNQCIDSFGGSTQPVTDDKQVVPGDKHISAFYPYAIPVFRILAGFYYIAAEKTAVRIYGLHYDSLALTHFVGHPAYHCIPSDYDSRVPCKIEIVQRGKGIAFTAHECSKSTVF